jgi:hypothetical protein
VEWKATSTDSLLHHSHNRDDDAVTNTAVLYAA